LTQPSGPLARLVGALRLDSIKNRILALAVVATLMPSLGTALLSYQQNRRALAENLNIELRSRGSQGAREIDIWLKERQYDVRVFTGSFEVSENLDRIQRGGAAAGAARARLGEYLVGVQGRFDDYAELLVLDAEGRVVISSHDPAGEVLLPPEARNRLERGDVVLGEPYWDAELARVATTLAVPIITADARFLGALAATLVFDAAGELLRSATPGRGGRVDLVTAEGFVVATSGEASSATEPRHVQPGTLAALRASAGESVELVERTGQPVVASLTAVPGLSWAVITQVPTSEAYAQAAELRSSALLLVAGLLVVVGGLAYLLGTVIVRPLERLAAGAGAVAAGDLTVDLPVTGRGEVSYLTSVFNGMVEKLRRSREELAERNRELERLSVTDALTGLHNRRFLVQAFEQEIRRADRHERPFSVLLIDVDRFKQFNDTHGHQAGDQVLLTMGRVITEAVRDLDVAARYGGEEFVVLLPECDLANAVAAAERIRARLARERFEHGPVTISVGVAEFPAHGETSSEVLAAADEALYEAKRRGRDRVCSAPPPPSEGEIREKATRRSVAAKKRRA
jgi:diguanylate cyclase (GGDEF)-like protein